MDDQHWELRQFSAENCGKLAQTVYEQIKKGLFKSASVDEITNTLRIMTESKEISFDQLNKEVKADLKAK